MANRVYGETISRAVARTVALSTVLAGVMAMSPARTVFYVAPSGNDSYNGLSATYTGASGPKRTINSALAEIRNLRQTNRLAADGAEIVVRPGTYSLREDRVDITSADSGTANSPLIIRAEITGTAVLDGAQKVTRWVRPTLSELEILTEKARQRVYVGLLDQRVFPNLGQLEAWQAQNENHTNRLPTAPEVFEGNERMKLAQWPNTGAGAAVTGISPNNTRDIPAITANLTGFRTPSGTPDVWTVGDYTKRSFHENMERVSAWNPQTGEVVYDLTGPDKAFGSRHPENQYPESHPNYVSRVRFVNSLYELDSPGEYYIDRTNRKIFVWLNNPDNRRNVAISLVQGGIVSIDNASHVTVKGLVLQRGRHDGVRVTDSRNITVEDMTVTNVGAAGVRMLASSDSVVRRANITEVGGTGIHVEAGDRATLRSGNVVVEQNEVSRTGRVQRFWRPGIHLKGVGLVARNNYVSDLPHSAITFDGNLHLIEKNVIRNTGQDATDTGAIYANHDWTEWGTRVEYNVIEGHARRMDSAFFNPAIYLDGASSGWTIKGNVFKSCDVGVFILGGHHNTVEDNVASDCYASLLIYALDSTNPTAYLAGWRTAASRAPVSSTAWQSAFPAMGALLARSDSELLVPRNNVVRNFVTFQSRNGALLTGKTWWSNPILINPAVTATNENTVTGLLTTRDASMFENAFANDFRPRAGSPAAELGFSPVVPNQAGRTDNTTILRSSARVGW